MDDLIERLDLAGYSDAPRYNIQAVESATGLSARTLRSWERRYGVPAPRRDTHGRRLYADRDIAIIRWLMGRVDKGVAISRAVAMLPEEGGRDDRPPPQIDRLQLRLLQAIDWMDEEEVTRLLSEAMRTAPPEVVVLELIGPVLHRIGDLWQGGHMSVGSEHFGTNILRSTLVETFLRAPLPSRPQHIMVGCPPGELHDVGALVFALLLRRAGYPVTYLGANLESESLMADLRRIQPAALCLSATMPDAAAAVRSLYTTLASAFGGVLAYGGSAFGHDTDVEASTPGVFLGTDVRAGVDALSATLHGV